MTRLIPLALLAATTAAAQVPPPSSAQPGFTPSRPAAQQRPCLTPTEARGLATFILPGLIDGLAQRCRGSLAREAFLRQSAADTLAKRLRRDAAPSWPVARSAIEKLNGERLPTLFGDRFIMGLAEPTAADLVLRDFDKADCTAADDLVAGLAPLPSANFSGVIAALIALGADAADDKAPVRICPAPVPPPAR